MESDDNYDDDDENMKSNQLLVPRFAPLPPNSLSLSLSGGAGQQIKWSITWGGGHQVVIVIIIMMMMMMMTTYQVISYMWTPTLLRFQSVHKYLPCTLYACFLQQGLLQVNKALTPSPFSSRVELISSQAILNSTSLRLWMCGDLSVLSTSISATLCVCFYALWW